MSVRGKIGFHFPGRGNPNVDAKDIKFLPSGISNPTSNDFRQVNKVYAIPAGVTITSVSDLQNYVVWELVEDVLTGDNTTDNYLMVKFKPSSNITVSSIGILTDSNGTGTTSAELIIVNDVGLLIYSGYNNSQESTETGVTKYGYTGYKRTRTFNSSVTLYAGKTYWIFYNFQNADDHRGAYFNGTSGKYKNMGTFNITSFGQSTTYPQYSNTNFGSFVDATTGAGNNAERIAILLSANENDLVYFDSQDWAPFYIRNNYLSGKYKCSIKSNNSDSITIEQFDACNFAIDDVFIIVNQHYDGQMTICQVKSLNGEITDRYNIIIGPSQDWSTLTNSFCSSLGNNKNCFIQYYNNGAGASYWNTTESGRTYYLEVNGNEHSSDAERG